MGLAGIKCCLFKIYRFERSACVAEDLKKINDAILRDFEYADRRSPEFNELHYKRVK